MKLMCFCSSVLLKTVVTLRTQLEMPEWTESNEIQDELNKNHTNN